MLTCWNRVNNAPRAMCAPKVALLQFYAFLYMQTGVTNAKAATTLTQT